MNILSSYKVTVRDSPATIPLKLAATALPEASFEGSFLQDAKQSIKKSARIKLAIFVKFFMFIPHELFEIYPQTRIVHHNMGT